MKPKVGRNFTSERGEGVKGEVKNISLHCLQGIFEMKMVITLTLMRQCDYYRINISVRKTSDGGGGCGWIAFLVGTLHTFRT